MDVNSTLPNKDDVVKVLLQKGSVFLHLDPRKEGVLVPEGLKDQYQLVLQIGYDMPVKIQDLFIDNDGVSATLSFNRTPFSCWVPWDSVFALIGEDGRGMFWGSDKITKNGLSERLSRFIDIVAYNKTDKEFEEKDRKQKATKLPPYLRIIK